LSLEKDTEGKECSSISHTSFPLQNDRHRALRKKAPAESLRLIESILLVDTETGVEVPLTDGMTIALPSYTIVAVPSFGVNTVKFSWDADADDVYVTVGGINEYPLCGLDSGPSFVLSPGLHTITAMACTCDNDNANDGICMCGVATTVAFTVGSSTSFDGGASSGSGGDTDTTGGGRGGGKSVGGDSGTTTIPPTPGGSGGSGGGGGGLDNTIQILALSIMDTSPVEEIPLYDQMYITMCGVGPSTNMVVVQVTVGVTTVILSVNDQPNGFVCVPMEVVQCRQCCHRVRIHSLPCHGRGSMNSTCTDQPLLLPLPFCKRYIDKGCRGERETTNVHVKHEYIHTCARERASFNC
jgi:hypothetical protein